MEVKKKCSSGEIEEEGTFLRAEPDRGLITSNTTGDTKAKHMHYYISKVNEF